MKNKVKVLGELWYSAARRAEDAHKLGDQLNEDILAIIEPLMSATSGLELEILEKLATAVEKYEKVRYPEFPPAASASSENDSVVAARNTEKENL